LGVLGEIRDNEVDLGALAREGSSHIEAGYAKTTAIVRRKFPT
jgi:hypothetical protein